MPIDIFEDIQKNTSPRDIFFEENLGSPTEEKNYSSQKNDVANLLGANRTPFDSLRDMAVGLGNAGQNIASTLTGGYAPRVNMQETIGPKTPNSLIQGLAQYVPFAAISGSGVMGQALGGAAYGATQSDSPIIAAPGYAAANVFTHGLINTLNKLSSLKSFERIKNLISPQSQANKINTKLSQGALNVEENNKLLARDLFNAHAKNYEEAMSHALPVLKKYGDVDLYPFVNKSGYHAEREFPKFKLNFQELKSPRLKSVFSRFKKSPTLNSAHELQKELGSEIGYWTKQKDDLYHRTAIQELKTARDIIKNRINTILTDNESNLANEYKIFQKKFKENVIPYRSDRILREIIEGHETNPKNIHTIFEYPTNKINPKTNKESIGPINKIIKDLTPKQQNRILFSALGGKEDAKNLLSALEDTKNKGFSNLYTPEIEAEKNTLKNSIKNRNILNKGAIWAGLPLLGAILGNKYF